MKLYLDKDIREALLNWEIENREMFYEDYMYYMTSSENEILHGIIQSLLGWLDEALEHLGFYKEDIEILTGNEFTIEFTNKNRYYIKQTN